MASLYLSGLFQKTLLSFNVPNPGATTTTSDRGIVSSPYKVLHILAQLDGETSTRNEQPLSGNQETESFYSGHVIKYWYNLEELEAVGLNLPPEVVEGAILPAVVNGIPGTAHILQAAQTSFTLAKRAGFGDRFRLKLIRRIDGRKA